MGYRIIYASGKSKKHSITRHHSLQKRIISYIVLLTILIGVGWIGWSNRTIRSWLLPGNPQVTERALQGFVSNIKSGEALSDAVAAFCNEIIRNEKDS